METLLTLIILVFAISFMPQNSYFRHKKRGRIAPTKIYLNNLLNVFFPTIPSADNPFLD